MPKRQLRDARVLVTGASSGLGWQLSLQLARAGARLLATARRQHLLDDLCQTIRDSGGTADCLAGDITDAEFRSRLLAQASDSLGGLDILVNNAGVGAMGPFVEASSQRLRQIMEVNFFAAAELSRSATGLLAAGRDPIIVNIASVLAHFAMPLKSEYCASKFAIRGWSMALAAELAPRGIRVLLVCPGTIDTPFFESAIEDTTGRAWKRFGVTSAERVAGATLRALARNRRELILPWSAKLAVWFERLFPGTLARWDR